MAQEVFLRVFRAKERYEPRARFSNVDPRIAVNASLNHLRSRKARRKISAELPRGPGAEEEVVFEDQSVPEPGRRLDEKEMAEILREILDSCPSARGRPST